MMEHIVCTIVTKSYLAFARTLASTLMAHNPNSKLYVLLVGKLDEQFDPNIECFTLIPLEDLPDQEVVEKMCFYYTPFELCCALRGMLHEYMFDKTTAQSWLFLDADIMICDSLRCIYQQLQKTSILLNPHATTPVNKEYIEPHEINFLRSGLYNAGFLGVNRTDESRRFITWFKQRLTNFCFHDYSRQEFALRGLFVDQLWLNLIPLYFKDVSFCLAPGANLGHWSLLEKTLNKDEFGNITVNDRSILFIHFSGWDINNPHQVSKYAPMYDSKSLNCWVELSELYRQKLLEHDYEKFIHYPYEFAYFQSGEPITLAMRRLYHAITIGSGEFEGSPFEKFTYFQRKLEEDNPNQLKRFLLKARRYIKSFAEAK